MPLINEIDVVGVVEMNCFRSVFEKTYLVRCILYTHLFLIINESYRKILIRCFILKIVIDRFEKTFNDIKFRTNEAL